MPLRFREFLGIILGVLLIGYALVYSPDSPRLTASTVTGQTASGFSSVLRTVLNRLGITPPARTPSLPATAGHAPPVPLIPSGDGIPQRSPVTGTTAVPDAPTNLVVGLSPLNTVTLSWNDNSIFEDWYEIEHSVNGAPFLQIDTALSAPPPNAQETVFKTQGVWGNNQFSYRVRAYNAVGYSVYSNIVTISAGGAPTVPLAPVSLVASPIVYPVGVKLTWKDDPANGSLTSVYLLERSTDGVSYKNIALIPALTSSPTYLDSAVAQEITYYYRLQAQNAVGGASLFTYISATVSSPTGPFGQLSVVLDSGSPGYSIAGPGQTVILAMLRYSALGEDVDVRQVALQLSDVGINSPTDVMGQQVILTDTFGTPLATAVFVPGDFATSSLIASGAFRVPNGGSRVMVIKGLLASISAAGPLTASGDLLKVDYDGNSVGVNGGNYGIGVSTGGTIIPQRNDTSVQGVRIMKL